jgi:hypothetical protein
MAKVRLKYSPIYVIWWDDAVSDSSWHDKTDLKLKPTIATTFGFLVHQDEDYVIVADSYFEEDDTVSNYTKIPRKMIKEIKEVELHDAIKRKVKQDIKEPT